MCRVHGVNFQASPDRFMASLKTLLPEGTTLDYNMLGNNFQLDLLSVSEPGNGTGSQIMDTLTRYWDLNQIKAHLKPDPGFGTPLPVLVRFYMKHGFTVNYSYFGSSRIMESMTREPQ